ncbi:MAG TPA: P-II family nitrogen regulator [Clostridiales bacterium]|nr:P-II family nitrogen regulator [Clostridiales bacterium]HPP35820.1 P-II family nitrogen regulator [Clostridiales bacterium]
MDNQCEAKPIEYQFQILTLILGEHESHKCVHIARDNGICGGILTLGRGTVHSGILNLLGIKSQKREIVSFLLEKDKAKELLDRFTEELQLHKHGHGIAYLTSVLVAGNETDRGQIFSNKGQYMEEEGMYSKLTVIVERGMAEDVMDAARKAGVGGGTIMHGRGVGAEYTMKLFGMEIEPEKELVMILMPNSLVNKVMDVIYDELHIGEPGKGIMFVESVAEVRGLFEQEKSEKENQ